MAHPRKHPWAQREMQVADGAPRARHSILRPRAKVAWSRRLAASIARLLAPGTLRLWRSQSALRALDERDNGEREEEQAADEGDHAL